MNKKVADHLERKTREERRRGLLRETVLVSLPQDPGVQRVLEYVSQCLLDQASESPPDPGCFGETLGRAKLRAAGAELRHLVVFVGDVANEDDPAQSQGLSASERRWAEAQRREILRLAVRFERRLGRAPERYDGQSDQEMK